MMMAETDCAKQEMAHYLTQLWPAMEVTEAAFID